MLKANVTFGAALPPLSDVEELRMQKPMGMDDQYPEVGAEGIVCQAAVLGEHKIPSNIDEYLTKSGRREGISPKYHEEHEVAR
jgi:hypothetical protein